MNVTRKLAVPGAGLLLPYLNHTPSMGKDVFIAPTASVIGRVTLGDRVSVWFGAVLRGDIAELSVGEESNIQDNCVMHVSEDVPCTVGRHCVVGHHAILHSCTIEDDCLIGMGAIILDGAVVGRGSVIGASSLIPQNMVIPPNSLVIGAPGKVRKVLSEEEHAQHLIYANKYVRIAERYRSLLTAG